MVNKWGDIWIPWLVDSNKAYPEPSSVTPGTRLEDIKRSKDFLDSDILKWIWSNPITKEEWEKERIISVTNPNPEPNSNLPPVLDYHASMTDDDLVRIRRVLHKFLTNQRSVR